MSGYVQFPNWIIDDIMPICTPQEWKVLCVIVRKTIGFKKQSDTISLSQLVNATGTKGKSNVIKARDGLIEKGIIHATKKGQSFSYTIASHDIGLVTNRDQSRNRTSTSHEIGQELVTKWDTQKKKETIKENIYIHPDPEPISNLKTELSKISKTPLWPKTEKEYDDAAYFFFGNDVKPKQLSGFTGWWTANGYYTGKPAIKSIVDEWQNYINGVTYSQNGNHQESEEVAPSGAF